MTSLWTLILNVSAYTRLENKRSVWNSNSNQIALWAKYEILFTQIFLHCSIWYLKQVTLDKKFWNLICSLANHSAILVPWNVYCAESCHLHKTVVLIYMYVCADSFFDFRIFLSSFSFSQWNLFVVRNVCF